MEKRIFSKVNFSMSATVYQSEYCDEREIGILKRDQNTISTKEKSLNVKSKLNSADLLLVAAHFLLCNGVQSICNCWLLLFTLAREQLTTSNCRQWLSSRVMGEK